MSSRSSRALLGLTLVGVATLMIGLGRPYLWEPDEPRFAEATRQMLLRGDYLTPWFNGRPRFEKPILFYWLQLPFFAGLGPTELAARLPAALAGIGCVWVTCSIGVRMLGARAGWIGGMALATLFRFVTYGRQGLTDVPALLFELLAIRGFLAARDDEAPRGAWITAWIAVGLAAATKGPVAIVPLAIWIAFVTVSRDWNGLRRMRVLPGALVALALAAPWYLYMFWLHGHAFANVSMGSEVVQRVTAPTGAQRGAFYYFSVWPADMLPWTLLFVLALVYAALAWRRFDARTRRGVLLPVLWFVVVVGIFSASGGKVPHYVLPAYPAACLLVGFLADRALGDPLARRLWWGGATCTGIALLVGGISSAIFVWRAGGADHVVDSAVLAAVLIGGPALALAMAWRRGPVAGTVTIAATLAVALAFAAAFVVPRLRGLQPLPPLGRAIAAVAAPDDRVGHSGSYGAPGLVFYSRHRVDALSGPGEIASYLQAPGRAFCVVPEDAVPAVIGLAPGNVHVLATEPKLVPRFNRLLGKRSPFEDGLALISNAAAVK
jgi:4-amino-4-deoxy-L-arabinose transferase-like glycosyltransferase